MSSRIQALLEPKREKYSELIQVRDSKRMVARVDAVAIARGLDRSSVYRQAIRYWLAVNGQLSDEEKRALGVKDDAGSR